MNAENALGAQKLVGQSTRWCKIEKIDLLGP